MRRKGGESMGYTNSIIELIGIEKTFVSGKHSVTALNDINLVIEEKDIYGIIGLSGAGKSTLVRCINMLEKPTNGKILFQGNDLTTMKSYQLSRARRSMGMIFQQFNLLMQRTALQNICFPLELAGMSKSKAKERAAELLEIVGLSEKANAYPSQLSGGQKQRIAIARALATNPKVLLCDEATSALDPTTTRSILKLLQDINQRLGITIVVITHEMSVIKEICNKVAIIDNSNVAETGDVNSVFTNPKTEIAKRLVFGENQKAEPIVSSNKSIVIEIPEDLIKHQKLLDYLETESINFEEVL